MGIQEIRVEVVHTGSANLLLPFLQFVIYLFFALNAMRQHGEQDSGNFVGVVEVEDAADVVEAEAVVEAEVVEAEVEADVVEVVVVEAEVAAVEDLVAEAY